MQRVFDTHDILWSNCVGIGLDNTSVNMGCRNSIKIRIVKKNSAAYVMECPCHIMHNTAGKAGDAFEEVFYKINLYVDLFFNIYTIIIGVWI